MGRQLGLFHDLVIVPSAVININMQASFYLLTWSSLGIYSGILQWVTWKIYFHFLEILPYQLPLWMEWFKPALYENINLSICSPTFGTLLLMPATLISVRLKRNTILISICLKNKHFSYWLIICISSFENCLLISLTCVLISLFYFLLSF